MDPITAAALAALAGGLGGEAGRQAWQGLTSKFHDGPPTESVDRFPAVG